jgi:hypothetical protein
MLLQFILVGFWGNCPADYKLRILVKGHSTSVEKAMDTVITLDKNDNIQTVQCNPNPKGMCINFPSIRNLPSKGQDENFTPFGTGYVRHFKIQIKDQINIFRSKKYYVHDCRAQGVRGIHNQYEYSDGYKRKRFISDEDDEDDDLFTINSFKKSYANSKGEKDTTDLMEKLANKTFIEFINKPQNYKYKYKSVLYQLWCQVDEGSIKWIDSEKPNMTGRVNPDQCIYGATGYKKLSFHPLEKICEKETIKWSDFNPPLHKLGLKGNGFKIEPPMCREKSDNQVQWLKDYGDSLLPIRVDFRQSNPVSYRERETILFFERTLISSPKPQLFDEMKKRLKINKFRKLLFRHRDIYKVITWKTLFESEYKEAIKFLVVDLDPWVKGIDDKLDSIRNRISQAYIIIITDNIDSTIEKYNRLFRENRDMIFSFIYYGNNKNKYNKLKRLMDREDRLNLYHYPFISTPHALSAIRRIFSGLKPIEQSNMNQINRNNRR